MKTDKESKSENNGWNGERKGKEGEIVCQTVKSGKMQNCKYLHNVEHMKYQNVCITSIHNFLKVIKVLKY